MKQLDFIDSTIERQITRMQIDLKILYARINALNDRMVILNMALESRARKKEKLAKMETVDMFTA